jgi:hypothetical protein
LPRFVQLKTSMDRDVLPNRASILS